MVEETKLTFEELTSITTQIEECLNSRPLTPLPEASHNLEVLIPGHFLTGPTTQSLTRPTIIGSQRPSIAAVATLSTYHLPFWRCWSLEYLCHLQRFSKWNVPTRNVNIRDIVRVQEECIFPTRWTLSRIIQTHPGQYRKVRIVTIRTPTGTYKRPTIKIVPVLCED